MLGLRPRLKYRPSLLDLIAKNNTEHLPTTTSGQAIQGGATQPVLLPLSQDGPPQPRSSPDQAPILPSIEFIQMAAVCPSLYSLWFNMRDMAG
jgi:hypothetical protein